MALTWTQRREELLSDCIVSPDVFNPMIDRLAAFVVPYQQALETEAAQRHLHRSLQGLLSHLPSKNAEAIATVVAVQRQGIQAFIGTAPWDHRPLIEVLVPQVAHQLGQPAGISAFAPSSCPKRGTHAVGGKRPWCGHRGKVDRCQVGVFLGSVSDHDQALLACRLSLPEEGARDEHRRPVCHVPPEMRDPTRQEQCLDRLDAWRDQGPHSGGTGEDELGRPTWCRHARRERDERSVLGGPCPLTMRDREALPPAYHGRGRRPKAPWHSVTAWRQSLAPTAWRRCTVRDGEKGPGAIEMVKRRVQTRLERKRTGPEEWLSITRRLLVDERTVEPRASRDAPAHDARYRSQYSLTPTHGAAVPCKEPAVEELARVIKAGACIEASCKRGQGDVGLDEYQVRTWHGWHHPLAVSLMAVWFLLGDTHRGQQWTPALPLPHVRYGLRVLLLEVYGTPGTDSICRHVSRQ